MIQTFGLLHNHTQLLREQAVAFGYLYIFIGDPDVLNVKRETDGQCNNRIGHCFFLLYALNGRKVMAVKSWRATFFHQFSTLVTERLSVDQVVSREI